MNENQIKTSIERITPAPGAETRMYHNIRAKAEKRKKPLLWLAPAAACLIFLLLLLYPQPSAPPPVMTGNPVVQVDGLEELAPAGLVPQLPEEAEITFCALISNEVARVEFNWRSGSYTCLSSARRDGDFTFVGGNQTLTQTLGEGITLFRLDDQIWKAEICRDDGRMYLINEDGADKTNVEELAKLLAE